MGAIFVRHNESVVAQAFDLAFYFVGELFLIIDVFNRYNIFVILTSVT